MSLQHLLLGLLEWQPLHGYSLREWAKTYGRIYPITNANVYPTLRRLESDGFVVHRQEVHNGRMRKVYETTEAGREELQRWLADPDAGRASVIDPVLLRLALLRGRSVGAARAWLEKEISASHSEELHSAEYLARQGDGLSKYDRMVLEYGLRQAQTRSEWLREALDEVTWDSHLERTQGV